MDSIIKHELIRLNAHLPESRLSLKEALSLSHPQISTKDGGVHAFKRDELRTLSKLLPESSWERLCLPILIFLEPERISPLGFFAIFLGGFYSNAFSFPFFVNSSVVYKFFIFPRRLFNRS